MAAAASFVGDGIMSRRFAAALCAAVATATFMAGCLTRKPDVEGLGLVAMTYSVPVTIESRFREDVTLFVLHDGMASRLARVGSVSTTRVVIPKHMVGSLGEIILQLEPLGARSGMSSRVQSPRVRVLAGQGLIWTLETDLARSFLQVVPAGLAQPDSGKPEAKP